ncbi:MAG: zf-HC2 domain-containing protein [Acidobacteriia bacterium]|nr:zf-HC2 domain-containing protein [Terriglobia bacterium]
MNCEEFEPAATLYLYDELSGAERAELEAHAAACESCRARLEASRRMHRLPWRHWSSSALAWVGLCARGLQVSRRRPSAPIRPVLAPPIWATCAYAASARWRQTRSRAACASPSTPSAV